MKKKNIGSTFDSWLREEGLYEEVSANAIKRVVARQVEEAMKEKHLTRTEMARRMHTSRAALDRLLDPDYEAITLTTLRKAAAVVGREIRLELAQSGESRGFAGVKPPSVQCICVEMNILRNLRAIQSWVMKQFPASFGLLGMQGPQHVCPASAVGHADF